MKPSNPWAWSPGPCIEFNGQLLSIPPDWEIHHYYPSYGEVMKEVARYFLHPKRSAITKDLRTPKYRTRVTPNTKKAQSKKACRNPGGNDGQAN